MLDYELMIKTCTKCGVEKVLNEFYNHKITNDGRRSECKECEKKYSKKYFEEHFEKVNKRVIKSNKIYLETDAGKITAAKHNAKRKRKFGYISLNNRFECCEGHHIDKECVIFIPGDMHRDNSHRQSDMESMKNINELAFEWLCSQEIL